MWALLSLLCRFGTWVWINDDSLFIYVWTGPLRSFIFHIVLEVYCVRKCRLIIFNLKYNKPNAQHAQRNDKRWRKAINTAIGQTACNDTHYSPGMSSSPCQQSVTCILAKVIQEQFCNQIPRKAALGKTLSAVPLSLAAHCFACYLWTAMMLMGFLGEF